MKAVAFERMPGGWSNLPGCDGGGGGPFQPLSLPLLPAPLSPSRAASAGPSSPWRPVVTSGKHQQEGGEWKRKGQRVCSSRVLSVSHTRVLATFLRQRLTWS